jgi:hypothetical protein
MESMIFVELDPRQESQSIIVKALQIFKNVHGHGSFVA